MQNIVTLLFELSTFSKTPYAVSNLGNDNDYLVIASKR